MERLDQTIERLIAGETLEPRYHIQKLRGGYTGHWECHVAPDFLLIWYLPPDEEIVSSVTDRTRISLNNARLVLKACDRES